MYWNKRGGLQIKFQNFKNKGHPSIHLYSDTLQDLIISSHMTTYDSCSYAVNGLQLWNDFPSDIRKWELTLALFKSKLKTRTNDVAVGVMILM